MKKILLVDDNLDILEPLCLLLESQGYLVKFSTKGEETYQIIREFMPHIVVLDIYLCGMDGREICKTIKRDQQTQEIPVIMMSAHPSAHTTISSSQADAFIAKPFDAQDFLHLIEKYSAAFS